LFLVHVLPDLKLELVRKYRPEGRLVFSFMAIDLVYVNKIRVYRRHRVNDQPQLRKIDSPTTKKKKMMMMRRRRRRTTTTTVVVAVAVVNVSSNF